MPITREYLQAQIADLKAQESHFLAKANAAHGAADMAAHLLSLLDNDQCEGPQTEMSVADLEKATGCKVESITPVNGAAE